MGTVQKIKNLSESGELSITANYYHDDNQIGYFWYYAKYTEPDGLEITSETPTLEQAINSVYSQLEHLHIKENMEWLGKDKNHVD